MTGQPHTRNLDRWESLVGHGDVPGLHRVLTGLDRDSIEMREVSPMGGLLPQDERSWPVIAGGAGGLPAVTTAASVSIPPATSLRSTTRFRLCIAAGHFRGK